MTDTNRPDSSHGMKVELHAHTNLYSGCSRIPPRELIAMAEASGYDAIFLTDHGKVWPPHELETLRALSGRVRIFPGVEISLPEGQDILILGADNPIYESLTSANEILAQACADGYLTVLAHPFRWDDTVAEYCTLLDAIEILTCNHPLEKQAETARAYADAHHLAPVYASDAHGLNFMNRFWIETSEPFETVQDLRRLIISGRYENCSRGTDAILPPLHKAASMDELAEDDLVGLYVQPTT